MIIDKKNPATTPAFFSEDYFESFASNHSWARMVGGPS